MSVVVITGYLPDQKITQSGRKGRDSAKTTIFTKMYIKYRVSLSHL